MKFRYDNLEGGGFKGTLQSKTMSHHRRKRNRINGYSKHNTDKKVHNLWPHPSTRQDTKPTEHTLMTIMYEHMMMKVSCGLAALELANKSSAPHSLSNTALRFTIQMGHIWAEPWVASNVTFISTPFTSRYRVQPLGHTRGFMRFKTDEETASTLRPVTVQVSLDG
jgi:hypothetical protein